MRKKKAQSDPMKFIIAALIILIVAFIVISLYNNWFGTAKKSGNGIIDMTSIDCDNDGKMYLFDNCVQNIDTSKPGCKDAQKKGNIGCE